MPERVNPDGGTVFPFRIVGTDPVSTPEPGTVDLYYKQGEGWKTKSYGQDAAEFGGGSTGFGFVVAGDLTTSGNGDIPALPVQRATELNELSVILRSEPTGDDAIFTFKKGDVATGTLTGAIGTLTVPDGDKSATATLSPAVLVEVGEFVTVEVTQIGDVDPGTTATLIAKGNG